MHNGETSPCSLITHNRGPVISLPKNKNLNYIQMHGLIARYNRTLWTSSLVWSFLPSFLKVQVFPFTGTPTTHTSLLYVLMLCSVPKSQAAGRLAINDISSIFVPSIFVLWRCTCKSSISSPFAWSLITLITVKSRHRLIWAFAILWNSLELEARRTRRHKFRITSLSTRAPTRTN